ncbi:HD domain-containing protein [Candidatus Parcubacteria bacterium]|nr:MAG: HD domain-containing protein [Candidatus Parcubacteria bacterium]
MSINMSNLEWLIDKAKEYGVEKESEFVLDGRFATWSGSSKPTAHHYGTGGLLEHVTEVVKLCLQSNEYFKTIDKGVDDRLLFLAALFHDVGKIWDYESYTDYNTGEIIWKSNDHKNKIHHISRSVIVWNEASVNMKQEERDEVTHAILAHHGQRAWGSPVEPQTRLAWLLHTCDHMSARMDDCDRKNGRA